MTDKFALSISHYQGDDSKLPFTLNPGDTITGCSGLWAAPDSIADELGSCDTCGRRTFRVVTITSVLSLQKQWALCGRHFIVSARVFPELSCRRGSEPA